MVLHGNRLEDLRALLTRFLQSQPLPVLQPEVILVQSNGMKHWLEMALADDSALGICAATRMELPGSYLWQIYRSVLGADAVPPHMPFDKAHLLWRLMRLLPALAATDPVYAPLQNYLQGGNNGRRLYQLAQQIADVLDGYQSYRADWLGDWAAARDQLRDHVGKPVALEDAQRWQACLWRAIRADVGEALADASRATVHARFMQRLTNQIEASRASGQPPAGIPPRIVVFGISSLSMQTVEALALLGQTSQVLMLVQNPCQYFWGDLVDGHAQLQRQLHRRQQPKPGPVGQGGLFDAPDAQASGHPLLASWGKQGRDYLHLLDGFDRVEDYRARMTRVDAFVDPVELMEVPSQLAQLQSAILNLEPPPAEPVALAPVDASITLVTSYSAQREVEVLHDHLLAWFGTDAALQPRDVMVMVPDMETFAPHIHAVFGRFARGQARHIPYAVADTTPRQSPLVQALEQLLGLPASRISLVDWLGLFEVSAVRKRFGLTPADIVQLQGWLSDAGVRWGLDAGHRQHWGFAAGLADGDQNTWAFGLRRLLLGYAVGPGSAWAGTLPEAAIKSLDAALVSNLLDWVDAVSLTLVQLRGDKAPEQWCQVATDLVARFFAASDDAEERLIQRMLEPLEVWQQACTDAALDAPLALDVVQEHWLSQIAEGGLHQRFFGGGVQFGTLMPMRSIPFKAICLLGMNDGDYPRQTAPRDFDLMAQSWRAGDRSRREDDRYLFLEALLSARERLYISWQGHRATDNSGQPPSVLVAQLIDYLNTGWTPKREPQAQPLQPYSEAYFRQGSAFQTYDGDWARLHGGAPADTEQGEAASSTAATATATATSGVQAAGAGGAAHAAAEAPLALTLDDLRQLLRQPVEVFFKARLRIRLDKLEDAQPELEPFALNQLEKFHAGQALLQADDAAKALVDLKLRGSLPLAGFGERLSATLGRETAVVLERRQAWREAYPAECPALAIDLEVAGATLTGTLRGLWSAQALAPGATRPTGACLQIGQRLGAVLEGKGDAQTARVHIVTGLWVNHLAACASGITLHSTQLGLDGQAVFEPLAAADALGLLAELVAVYREAWQRPLPVACKTAWAYRQASAKDDGKDPHEVARAVFEGGYRSGSEWSDSPYVARAFETYDDLADELPHWADALYAAMAGQVRLRSEGEAT